MNVFEDLIVELKQENLLEQTVIDETEARPNVEPGSPLDEFVVVDRNADEDDAIHITADSDPPADGLMPVGSVPADTKQPEKKGDEFKNRAVAEVAALQMVDHVLTGVEREYTKAVTEPFDDFNAKKALNAFLQADPDGRAEAEFVLVQETEAWCSAVAARDARIPVSNLRLYCENTKPALSSQTFLSLARFYRNLPYAEPVRAKFDFVMTRLFSRPTQGGKRVCLFDSFEALDHINTLYGEWSSVPLYAAEDDESKVLLTALSFEDLAVEAENAGSVDQLIASNFFGRLRLFKESISDLFFAPNVTSAAIEANVRIGNAYVDLIGREREKLDDDSIQSKYLDVDDQSVSDAAAQSLGLLDLLTRASEPVEEPTLEDDVQDEPTVEQPVLEPKGEKKKAQDAKSRRGFLAHLKEHAFEVNRWVLISALVLTLASVGIYVWANYFAEERVPTTGVVKATVNVPEFAKHIKVAKISNDLLYVHLRETWDELPKKKRHDLLQEVLQAGEEGGWAKVQLLSLDGTNAGYASAHRVEVPDL